MAEAIASAARANARGTHASSGFMRVTRSFVDSRSRSAAAGSQASVASSSMLEVLSTVVRKLVTSPVYARSGRVVKTSGRRGLVEGGARIPYRARGLHIESFGGRR